MLRKGIIRRRVTQPALRSWQRPKWNRSGLGRSSSALISESLASTLVRAEMRKSLLEWGDDDSILLKPYPIENFESGMMLSGTPGGVLDYKTNVGSDDGKEGVKKDDKFEDVSKVSS